MKYDSEEVQTLVQIMKDDESLPDSLPEIESILGSQWLKQKKRDGVSLDQIKDQIKNIVSESE